MTALPEGFVPSTDITDRLIEQARKWDRTATPEQKRAMWEAQRESWIRAFRPCEHGDYDWETCPQCLADLKTEEPRHD